jgi:hypothetical protein
MRALPLEMQEEAARMLLAYAGDAEPILMLTPEEECSKPKRRCAAASLRPPPKSRRSSLNIAGEAALSKARLQQNRRRAWVYRSTIPGRRSITDNPETHLHRTGLVDAVADRVRRAHRARLQPRHSPSGLDKESDNFFRRQLIAEKQKMS